MDGATGGAGEAGVDTEAGLSRLRGMRKLVTAAGHLGRLAGALALAAQALAGEADLAPSQLLVEGWRHRVWLVYPPEKIKADQDLPLEPRGQAIVLSSARNEPEPFVLALRTEMPLREVSVRAGALHGPQGAVLAAENITSRRVGYVFVDEPSGTRIADPMPYDTGTGWYPDPLLGGAGLARPGRNLQFWVTVRVPPATPPGSYEGEAEVCFRKESWMPPGKLPESIRIPLRLQVRTFALPETSPLRNTAFFNPNLPHGKAADPVWMEGLYRDFVAHRQTPEPVLPSPQVKILADGSVGVDASGWERAAGRLLEEWHVPHVFVPVWSFGAQAPMQGIYFLWHYPAVMSQRWQGALICGQDRRLTAEFQQRFGAYLAAVEEIVKRRGWAGRVYLATMDEPYTCHTGDRQMDVPEHNYEVVRNFVALVRQTAPSLKTFVTGDPVPGLTGVVDHWCLRNLQHAAEARLRSERHGEMVTFCDNYRTFIDYPAVSARSLGWLAWKLGAQGWLTYETMGGLNTAWEGPLTVYPSFHGPLLWGMGQMFYPDPVGEGLAPSLRWDMMREGCDDYEYLWLLRERWQSLPADARESEAGRRARALLDTAADEVVGGRGDPETQSSAPKANAQSNRVPHRLRETIAELLEALPAPSPPP